MPGFSNIVVCDSGFGGLDISRLLMDSLYRNGVSERGKVININYINAWPHEHYGYNHLGSASDKQLIFSNLLEGIKSFNPEICIFACNTLSVIYHASPWKQTKMPFEIKDMIYPTVSSLLAMMNSEPDAIAVITGTVTTIGPGYYPRLLEAHGIAGERIVSQPCPYLSTMIEAGPQQQEVTNAIRRYATEAFNKIEGKRYKKVFLALCCTHYGYSTLIWRQVFEEVFGCEVKIVNPNLLLSYDEWCEHGEFVPEINFEIYSRVKLLPERIAAMSEVFSSGVPIITQALQHYNYDAGLFKAPDLL